MPWKDIVKAFEYDKGSYVVLEKEDIKSAAPESHESIEVEAFVDAGSIDPRYYEKPYVLVPARRPKRVTCCCARPCEDQQEDRHRAGGHPHARIPVRGDAARAMRWC